MHRRKKTKRVNKVEVQQAAVDSQVRGPHATRQNRLEDCEGQTSLLFSLAAELLLEIIAYFPKVPERVWIGSEPILPKLYLERPDALRTLTQTCRALRKFFVPLYWEHLDVCTNRFGGAWHLHVSSTLEARSIGLSQRPDLAVHIRVVNVVLTRCSTDTVLPEFAQCLAQLPNLHTLQIVHAHTQMTMALGQHFQGFKYPSIRTVILQGHAHNILRCCPEVRTVICTEGESSKLVSAIRNACPKVEVIRGFRITPPQMKALVRVVPNLRCIEISEVIPDKPEDSVETMMRMLSSFKKLSTIEIVNRISDNSPSFGNTHHRPCTTAAVDNHFGIEEKVRIARRILSKAGPGEKKILRIVNRKPPAAAGYYGGHKDERQPVSAIATAEEIEI